MGPQRPMKLINFSRLMFVAIWLTIFYYKDYTTGFSVTKQKKKKNQRKNRVLFRKIVINAKVCKISGKMKKIQNYMFWYNELKNTASLIFPPNLAKKEESVNFL